MKTKKIIFIMCIMVIVLLSKGCYSASCNCYMEKGCVTLYAVTDRNDTVATKSFCFEKRSQYIDSLETFNSYLIVQHFYHTTIQAGQIENYEQDKVFNLSENEANSYAKQGYECECYK